jgi:hypothetical protein
MKENVMSSDLLTAETLEQREEVRKGRIAQNREAIVQIQKQIAEDHLIGAARAIRSENPDIRFVRLNFPWNAIGSGAVRVVEVLDEDYHKIADAGYNNSICFQIERLIGVHAIHDFLTFESGEYDFKELAERP